MGNKTTKPDVERFVELANELRDILKSWEYLEIVIRRPQKDESDHS